MNIIDNKLKNLDYLINCIKNESVKQLDKWGIQDRHIFEWSMWTMEEFGEFVQAINEYNYGRTDNIDDIMEEGIQTITLLLKMLDGLIENEE